MSKAPKLRFKEFSGDWESKKLGDVINYKKGYAFKSNDYKNEGIRIIKISDTSATSIKDTDITCISKEEANNYKEWELKTNDIIVSTVGSRPPLYSSMVGKIILIPKECENNLLNQNLVRLRTNELSTQKYLYNYLNSKRYLNYIEGICRGNANQVSITLEDLFEYKIRLPKIKEQEKIASFFSLIDDKISLQSEKLEMLKDYKRGMMQKIFSRELRFKDDEGRDYPEWEVTTIEKVADLEKGFTPDTKNEKNWIGDTPWLSIADMKQGKYVSNVSKHISDEALGNKKLVPKGTLIMSFKLTLGRLGIINREMMTNEAICHFYWRNKSINTEYMYYYLSTVNIESFGCRAAKGITLNNDSLNSIVVKLPVIEEQNKIADILMKIDRKVEKEQEKLDSLNEYKKGLLQQMFV